MIQSSSELCYMWYSGTWYTSFFTSTWYTRCGDSSHRISRLVVLRPELRQYWAKYKRVLIVDATHGISVTGFKLFTIVVVDSLFRSVLVAYSFIRSESFLNLDFIAQELGIDKEKITVISDDSEATKLLASTHGWLHLLCQWHYAACYIQALKSKGVRHSDCASYNSARASNMENCDSESVLRNTA